MPDAFPPITDADLRAAWDALYAPTSPWADAGRRVEPTDSYLDQHTMIGLRLVLETDRKRVYDSHFYSENRHT
jgi:hypothetical protein